jgi:hypothetical protein
MRALELNVPPVYVPLSVSELAAPEAPTEPGTETIACAEAPAPIVPIVCGSGVAESEPTLTLVRTTLAAAVPPVLAIVSWTTTLPVLRVSTFVTTRSAGDDGGAAGFTVIVVDAVAGV